MREVNYDRLRQPDWTTPKVGRLMREEHLRTFPEEIFQAAIEKNSLSYSQFSLFETRIRELRHYMDGQKPRRFRQLWKDNRDSLNYYTFWGVIFFGVLSVFLALFSLVSALPRQWHRSRLWKLLRRLLVAS